MPRTKKPQTEPATPTAAPPAALNGPPGEVLTLAEAAAYLRLAENQVVELVHFHGLPGRRLGGDWRFLKAAIQVWLCTAAATTETRKAAQLAAAGTFKDDPDLLRIVEDIYRQRGRPITEDGSYNLLHGLEPRSSPK